MGIQVKVLFQKTFKLWLSLSLLCVTYCGLTNHAVADSNKLQTILVFGDSLSAGYGIKQSDSWASLLQTRIQTENKPYKVINASVSGETTSGGLQRLPSVIKRINPSIVIIALGANDGLRGLPMQTMEKNLQSMINKAKAIKAKVLLVGMRIPPNYGPQYTNRFIQTYQALSKKNKIPLVPFLLANVSEDQALMQTDGLHPNKHGQAILLENIWPSLEALL